MRYSDTLLDAREKWQSNNITNYEFKLDLFFGGRETWEGFGGYSSGAEIKKSIIIKIHNGNTIEVTDNITGNLMRLDENQFSDSMPDLFVIIEDILNRRNNLDLDMKASTIESTADVYYHPNNAIPRLVHADFNSEYGFPEIKST